MQEFKYVVKDELGIHARPAGVLAKKAKEFTSVVTIRKGEKSVEMRKLMALMALGVKCGEEVTVSAEGEDENEAVAAFKELFEKEL